ncbi:hypothetical protein J3E74DRAFT_293794 [Bipolaris maydis]|nr:hypothetical protein J3E74DRAFT_293794 [Bipolaris maydis]
MKRTLIFAAVAAISSAAAIFPDKFLEERQCLVNGFVHSIKSQLPLILSSAPPQRDVIATREFSIQSALANYHVGAYKSIRATIRVCILSEATLCNRMSAWSSYFRNIWIFISLVIAKAGSFPPSHTLDCCQKLWINITTTRLKNIT